MTHVLVTFLGAPDTGRPPSLRPGSGYAEIGYEFLRDKIYRERLFPLALLKHLKETKTPADRMVVFGTAGSAWQQLPLCALGCWPEKGQLDVLARRSAEGKVQADDLKPFQNHQRLKDILHLQGGLNLRLMGYAETEGEQVGVIAKLFEAAHDATTVTIDVTHGLRYLPLLGSLAAYVMQASTKVPVKVWYGAYDMRETTPLGEETAPAIELGGLSRIVDWLAAFKNFEWDGDYWAFAEALKKGDSDEKAAGNLLAEAAFFERIGRFKEAQEKFKQFATNVDGLLKKAPTAHGLIGLFKDALSERIALSSLSGEELYKHQCSLAWHHLNHEDIVHASIWGCEAAITKLTLKKKTSDQDLRSFKVRNSIVAKYNDEKQTPCISEQEKKELKYFRKIKAIRNTLAHGDMEENEKFFETKEISIAGFDEILRDGFAFWLDRPENRTAKP